MTLRIATPIAEALPSAFGRGFAIRTARTCACGAHIWVTPDVEGTYATECGGEGEGTCDLYQDSDPIARLAHLDAHGDWDGTVPLAATGAIPYPPPPHVATAMHTYGVLRAAVTASERIAALREAHGVPDAIADRQVDDWVHRYSTRPATRIR